MFVGYCYAQYKQSKTKGTEQSKTLQDKINAVGSKNIAARDTHRALLF